MPAWPDTVIDNFNRANASVGSPWANQYTFGSNGLRIESNECRGDLGLYGEMAYADAALSALEQAAFCTWKSGTWASGADFGANVRASGSTTGGSGYRLAINPATGVWTLQRVTGGNTITQLGATATQAVAVSNKARLTIEGTSAPFTIKAWIDTGSGWVEVMSRTDSTITGAGYPGMYLYRGSGSPTAFLDDFGGGTAVAGGSFELDCQPNSFALTGTAATTAVGRLFQADPASFTLTGTAASPLADRALNANPAVFEVTGLDTSVLADRLFPADPGAYALSGINADLVLSTPAAEGPFAFQTPFAGARW